MERRKWYYELCAQGNCARKFGYQGFLLADLVMRVGDLCRQGISASRFSVGIVRAEAGGSASRFSIVRNYAGRGIVRKLAI